MEEPGRPITAGSLPASEDHAAPGRGRLTLETARRLVAGEGGNLARAARKSGWSERQLRRVLAMGRGVGDGNSSNSICDLSEAG
jgi:hypothetical protein